MARKHLKPDIRGMESKVQNIETDVRIIKDTLGWHWKIGALIASFIVVVLGGLLTWYLPKELNDLRQQITADTKVTIGEERKQISAEIKAAVADALAPAFQKLVLPKGKIGAAPVSELQNRFELATSTIDSIIPAMIPTNPQSLAALQGFIRTALEMRGKEMPKHVQTEGLAAFIYVRGYSTFSQNVFENNRYYFIGLTIREWGTAINMVGDARGKTVVYDSKIIDIGSQDISDIKWIRTTFQNAKIVYHGGDVYLAEVTFKNCTYDFSPDKASQALRNKLIESERQGTRATVLYAKTEPVLSALALAD